MSYDNDQKTTITLLDKPYQIKCTSDKADALQKAAKTLNDEMRKMRETGIVGMDRIAIIAGLNMAHHYNESKSQVDQCVKSINERVQGLQKRIDDVLIHAEQLELDS